MNGGTATSLEDSVLDLSNYSDFLAAYLKDQYAPNFRPRVCQYPTCNVETGKDFLCALHVNWDGVVKDQPEFVWGPWTGGGVYCEHACVGVTKFNGTECMPDIANSLYRSCYCACGAYRTSRRV